MANIYGVHMSQEGVQPIKKQELCKVQKSESLQAGIQKSEQADVKRWQKKNIQSSP